MKTATNLTRRAVLSTTGAAVLTGIPFIAKAKTGQRVVVIGGGFGGATAAKYLKRLNPALQVVMIEPNNEFTMCPLSNRVLHGGLSLRDISRPYDRFTTKYDIRWIKSMANEIDLDKREVLVGNQKVPFDWLIVSPGVDYVYDGILGMESAESQALIPHAWKAGAQTQQLKDMLKAMRPGGTVAMHIPKTPYRCPPGPYERASLIAYLLKNTNPTAKLMVFDSNPEIQAKKSLFESVWKTRYSGLIEYVANAEIERVDAPQRTLNFVLHGKHKADVINLIPPQRAGTVARKAGLANVGNRWCGVDFL